MPHWLIIAVSILWWLHAIEMLWIIHSYIVRTPYQRQLWQLNSVGKFVLISFVPFTVFWWSWVIFG